MTPITKVLLFILAVVVLVCCKKDEHEPFYSPNVYIPDYNFYNALIYLRADHNRDGIISYREAFQIKSLDVCSKRISDLTGIEAFVNLEHLACSNNLLTSLDISNNNALNDLECSKNLLTSLDVSNNTALGDLDCSGNELTSIDLSSNTNLEILRCSGNQFTTLDLSNNTILGSRCGLDLDISDMPTLYQVCVWVMPFPPDIYIWDCRRIVIDSTGSPNVYFTTECSK